LERTEGGRSVQRKRGGGSHENVVTIPKSSLGDEKKERKSVKKTEGLGSPETQFIRDKKERKTKKERRGSRKERRGGGAESVFFSRCPPKKDQMGLDALKGRRKSSKTVASATFRR